MGRRSLVTDSTGSLLTAVGVDARRSAPTISKATRAPVLLDLAPRCERREQDREAFGAGRDRRREHERRRQATIRRAVMFREHREERAVAFGPCAQLDCGGIELVDRCSEL